ncbi:hypothetical protein DNU06_14180 [Putridiphycobacter roseus]|uniref:Uncharacterized protein n=1 Tax=Putridiphycobacter roseus TaxID=2219161 RepID=A0A2W1NB38_9FLAO|nr:hypothetical protein [Putridiphycobacter roseus]PZE16273.1 hypothetical protein DNU06_14180 [Putridiphycobacter roseus]
MNQLIHKRYALTGHTGAIYDLAFNDKKEQLYSGSFDNQIIAWDINNPAIAQLIAKVQSKPITIQYLNKRNWLLIGQANGNISVLDLSLGKEIKVLQYHSGMVYALTVDDEECILYSGAEDGHIVSWDLVKLERSQSKNLGSLKVRVILKIENQLYVGCGTGSLLILDKENLELEQEISQLHVKNFSIYTLLYIREKNILLSGSRDGHIGVLDLLTYKVKERIPAHNFAIYDFKRSSDGIYFASASRDKSIKIWRISDFQFQEKIDFKSSEGHKASVNAILWNENHLISCSDDKQIIIWDYKK